MAKSQLNNMSKKEILQSLMYEQNQSNATLSRLITAVARTAGVDATKLAEMFTQDKENQDYVESFNVAVKEIHSKRVKDETKAAAALADSMTPKSEGAAEEVKPETTEPETAKEE